MGTITDLRKSKLYYHLSKLSCAQLDRFQSLAGAQAFNPEPKLILLLEALINHLKLHPDMPLSKVELVGRLYGKGKNAPVKLAKEMSKLLTLSIKFVGMEQFEHEEHMARFMELRGMREMGMVKYLDKAHPKLKADLGTNSTHALYLQFLNQKEMYLLDKEANSRNKNKGVQAVLDQLDQYFIAQKLKYACIAKNQELIVGTEHEIGFQQSILEAVESGWNEFPILVKAYYFVFQSLDAPKDKTWYHQLKRLLFGREGEIGRDEWPDLLTFILNYCARAINRGEREFQVEMGEWYLKALDVGEILEADGSISKENFKNIVTTMAKLGAVEWTCKFIEDFHANIYNDAKGQAYRYGIGILKFFQADYRESRREFDQVVIESDDIFFKLDSRIMIVKCWFELQEWKLLEGELGAFRKFVGRYADVLGERKQAFNFFNKTVAKLALADSELPEKRLKKLGEVKKAIMGRKDRHLFTWLLEKAEEMQARK